MAVVSGCAVPIKESAQNICAVKEEYEVLGAIWSKAKIYVPEVVMVMSCPIFPLTSAAKSINCLGSHFHRELITAILYRNNIIITLVDDVVADFFHFLVSLST